MIENENHFEIFEPKYNFENRCDQFVGHFTFSKKEIDHQIDNIKQRTSQFLHLNIIQSNRTMDLIHMTIA